MDEPKRNLLRLGAEDYTGLWQAVAEACNDIEPCSLSEARRQVRQIIDSLLVGGLIELFICQEPLNNEAVEIVPPERRPAVLDEVASWGAPEEGGKSVRFSTTERGFAMYQKEAGWAAN
jgi:hypothetical protein